MALLLAGLPVSVPGETVNRLCASGMTAVATAARGIRSGDGDIFIAGGVESMTRAPYVMSKSAKPFGRDVEIFDTSIGWRFVNPKMREAYGIDSMGQTAENVADQFKVSRQDQDLFACRSQSKAAAARSAGRFAVEITPVKLAPARKGAAPRVFAEDEFIRPDTSIEVLGKLRPAFRTDGGGSVTAGNSSGINDGACALLIASDAGVKELGGTAGADRRVRGGRRRAADHGNGPRSGDACGPRARACRSTTCPCSSSTKRSRRRRWRACASWALRTTTHASIRTVARSR
jgi:acetyl-CoA acetyltransferase family protein